MEQAGAEPSAPAFLPDTGKLYSAMKSRFQTAVVLLVAGLAVWVAGVDARAQPVPAAIVLNGITTILGDHRACFKVIFTGDLREDDFMLAEGEGRYGIQLLKVDTRLNAVTINNQGLTQIMPICKTPVLLAQAPSEAGGVAPAKFGARNHSGTAYSGGLQTSSDEVQPGSDGPFARPGHATGPDGGPPGSSQPGSASNNSDTSGNNASAGNDSGAGFSDASSGIIDNATQGYHWWVKEAQGIEQARKTTAQQVMDGTVPPFPLTPFTPPGTSPQLVGPNRMYFYFDPLASND